MHELTLDEVHALDLDMLIAIDQYCMENDLKYYLAYGTLLGAVRHGGFIPWDDDADIVMMREDFEKLVENWKPPEGYKHIKLLKPCTDGYAFGWAKLIDTRTSYKNPKVELPNEYGMAIDIFPLDCDRGLLQDTIIRIHNRLRTVNRDICVRENQRSSEDPLKVMLKGFVRLLPKSLFGRAVQRVLISTGFRRDKYVLCHFTPYEYKVERIPINAYGTGQRILFENHLLSVPDEYESVLRQIYGNDWMTPVVSNRHASYYWREEG